MQKVGFSVKLIDFVGSVLFIAMGVISLGAFSYSAIYLGAPTFVAKIAYCLFGIWCILIVMMANLFCWHYDKYLKDKILNNPLSKALVISFVAPCNNNTLLKFKLFRMINFYFPAVGNLKRYRQNPDMQKVFDDFDFKKHVTHFEKFLMWAFTVIMVMMFMFILLYATQMIFR